jgi:hypothetical protein
MCRVHRNKQRAMWFREAKPHSEEGSKKPKKEMTQLRWVSITSVRRTKRRRGISCADGARYVLPHR